MGRQIVRRLRVAVALVTAIAWTGTPIFAQRSLEYEVKGKLLYNFLSFIEWPPSAFAQPDAPFLLCLIGTDPFGRSLDDIARGQRVQGHPIQIERVTEERGLGSCHALFVSRLDDTRLSAVVHALGRRSVLVVGESRRVLELCGGIAFVVDGDKVRFDINVPALASRGLTASSKLLHVAREASGRFARCD